MQSTMNMYKFDQKIVCVASLPDLEDTFWEGNPFHLPQEDNQSSHYSAAVLICNDLTLYHCLDT